MHWFGANGLANGLAVLADETTWSNWDHMTGECFGGDYEGARLDWWPVTISTVDAALQTYEDIRFYPSPRQSIAGEVMKNMSKLRNTIEGRSGFPPHFRGTMSRPIDDRLPEMQNGLGVIVEEKGRFYPMSTIARGETVVDQWLGRPLQVTRSDLDGVLSARWLDTVEDDIPMQLLTRWYGFSFNWPDCEIYQP